MSKRRRWDEVVVVVFDSERGDYNKSSKVFDFVGNECGDGRKLERSMKLSSREEKGKICGIKEDDRDSFFKKGEVGWFSRFKILDRSGRCY